MKEIEDILGKDNIMYNEPMSKHTSFKVGGPAEIFAKIDSVDKVKDILKFCKENNIKVTVIGNGTNLLVSDKGIKGLVIKYTANDIKIDKTSGEVICSGGVLNPVLANKLLENELTGFEFASGIPGTIAGAVYMNAGAYDGEISKLITYVQYIDIDTNEIKVLSNEELDYSYRKSIFQKMNTVILEVGMKFKKGNKEEIKAKMLENKEKRVSTQPQDFPNAGSTFKRGKDFISAKLIDEAGLKGYQIGGAKVSEKHAGFVVNTGNATAEDIINLIEYVKKVVYEKYGKKLETEVRIIK